MTAVVKTCRYVLLVWLAYAVMAGNATLTAVSLAGLGTCQLWLPSCVASDYWARIARGLSGRATVTPEVHGYTTGQVERALSDQARLRRCVMCNVWRPARYLDHHGACQHHQPDDYATCRTCGEIRPMAAMVLGTCSTHWKENC